MINEKNLEPIFTWDVQNLKCSSHWQILGPLDGTVPNLKVQMVIETYTMSFL